MGEVKSGTPCKDIKKINGENNDITKQNKAAEGLYKINVIVIFKVFVFVKE